ncbi:hypothetical protein BBBOND_0308430 [Babesia bigemina]|uniref:Uncharacterized protein n=1 Tax=Babesia bigemina TaxID=5866 RepID=A0A061DCW6_BABBI|nr:hypothetical protein BBBOND_0308430 [Babesia bigemina]CDR96939.1 hypothetical protein BBBOND_0308430 [Babesia bigemina]|eukprot:XP_012769125.1 hypothetical protein BBBOND_0308430 [Babesia bigemina]
MQTIPHLVEGPDAEVAHDADDEDDEYDEDDDESDGGSGSGATGRIGGKMFTGLKTLRAGGMRNTGRWGCPFLFTTVTFTSGDGIVFEVYANGSIANMICNGFL